MPSLNVSFNPLFSNGKEAKRLKPRLSPGLLRNGAIAKALAARTTSDELGISLLSAM